MGKYSIRSTAKILIVYFSIFIYGIMSSASFYDIPSEVEKKLDLKDFGAVGDGVADDSNAIVKALAFVENKNYTVLDFEGNFVYNLNNKKIQLPKRLSIRFSGVVLKNAELIGNNTLIIADPVRIFDQVRLSGNFVNTDKIYVEWFGTLPNDASSIDLKTSLEQINKVYFSVSLNSGIYYTKLGNIDLKGITGISPGQTFVEFQSNADNLHLFHIGKIKGKVSERTYENNFLKSVSLSLTSSKKIYNNTLLIIGACHQAKIDDVKFIANSASTSLNNRELENVYSNDKSKELANISIRFDGASELLDFNNIFTLSDIGIRFTSNTDFVKISNYSAWNGLNGFSAVYFDDTTVSNILFTGYQSWSQGLYGVYAKNATGYNNFVNVKFENVRIEQLNTTVKNNNKVVAASFYFGDYTHVPNLIISNVMLAGTANGIRFGTVQDGRISLDNIAVFYDQQIPRKYALEITFKNEGEAQLSMLNVQLPADLPMLISNSDYEKTVKDNKFVNTLIKRK